MVYSFSNQIFFWFRCDWFFRFSNLNLNQWNIFFFSCFTDLLIYFSQNSFEWFDDDDTFFFLSLSKRYLITSDRFPFSLEVPILEEKKNLKFLFWIYSGNLQWFAFETRTIQAWWWWWWWWWLAMMETIIIIFLIKNVLTDYFRLLAFFFLLIAFSDNRSIFHCNPIWFRFISIISLVVSFVSNRLPSSQTILVDYRIRHTHVFFCEKKMRDKKNEMILY